MRLAISPSYLLLFLSCFARNSGKCKRFLFATSGVDYCRSAQASVLQQSILGTTAIEHGLDLFQAVSRFADSAFKAMEGFFPVPVAGHLFLMAPHAEFRTRRLRLDRPAVLPGTPLLFPSPLGQHMVHLLPFVIGPFAELADHLRQLGQSLFDGRIVAEVAEHVLPYLAAIAVALDKVILDRPALGGLLVNEHHSTLFARCSATRHRSPQH